MHRPLLRLRTALGASLLALACALAVPGGALAQDGTYELRLSSAPDRSASTALEGAQVSGDMYVFLAPESGVSKVKFYIDDPERAGSAHQIEGVAPYDMNGTAADGTANPFNSALLGNGSHTVTAEVIKGDGTTEVVDATFTVDNEQHLWLSASPDRSDAVLLEGRTVEGDIYVFVASDPGISTVTFYLDDPDMQGAPHHADLMEPWDFAGEGTLGEAPPFDTTTIANGEHSITASIEWVDGTTSTLTSAFTVDNPQPADYRLLVSTNHDRSSPVALAGSTVEREIYAFLDPEQDVKRVDFYVDDPERTGSPYHSEGAAPYDLAGTRSDGTAVPFDTRDLADGSHTVTAAVETTAGDVVVIDATFTVDNSGSDCRPLACSEVLISYPYALGFSQDHGKIEDGAGVGTGFTWVDPPTGHDGYKPERLAVDLEKGRFQITTTSGLAHAGSNDQDNTLGVGLPVDTDEEAALETTLVNPPSGSGSYEQGGLWLGNDQDNFAKLVVVSTSSGTKVQLLVETDGKVASQARSDTLSVSSARVTLLLRADPVAGTVTGEYRIGSGSLQSLGSLSAPPELFSRGDAVIDPQIGTATFGGVFASHRRGPSPLTYVFDRFSADVYEPPPPPPKCNPLPCEEVLVELPHALDFESDHGKVAERDGEGTGFTIVKPPASGTGYLPERLDLDLTAGQLKIDTTAGVFHKGANSQDNALAVGVDAPSQITVVQATLAPPPDGSGGYEQAGIWFGNDQDNYLKLVLMSTPVGPQVEHLMEVDGGVTASKQAKVDPAGSSVTFTLSANPVTQEVTATYSIGAGSPQPLGTFIAPGELFSFDGAGIDQEIGTNTFTGVLATHRRGPAPLTYAFEAFSVTAEEAPPPPPDPDGVSFERSTFPIPSPTSLAHGLGDKLYALELFGTIHELTLGADGLPTSDKEIGTIGTRLALGIEVDPLSTAEEPVLWVSHSSPSLSDGEPNSGVISRLSGPDLTERVDVITGLPRAKANHATNSIHFGPDGRLYIAQGGNTGAGAPNDADTEFGDMEEQPLSAAMLVADVRDPGFDGSCNNPDDIFGPPPCDVEVLASGLRNTYDFVFHSNGLIYGPDNGLGVTGTFPPSPEPPCFGFGDTASWEDGGHNPGPQPDNLNVIEPGNYYGHPNPYRDECVFKDGSYQGVAPPPNYVPAVHNLGDNRSANGTIEYLADTFCGNLQGDLLIANFSVGDDITRVQLADDGRSVDAATSLIGSFNDPLPLAQSPGGMVYVGELGANRVTALTPRELGCWRTGAPLPEKVLDAGGAALGGRVYVVGGKTSTEYRSTVDVYDPGTDSWSVGPSLPGPAVENPAVVALDGKLYAFGGSTAPFSGAVDNAAVLDPATGEWTPLAPMPTARGGPAAAVVDGMIYVVGGMDADGASVATVEVYDPATDSWSAGPPMGTRRDNPAAAAADGMLYVFGGRTRNADGSTVDGTLSSVEMLDPATGEWTARASMPTGRRTMVMGRLGGRMQLMGGELRSDGAAFAKNEEYDPATDTWRTLQPMPTGRHGAAGGTVNGEVFVIGGGPTGGSSFTDVNEAYSLP